MYSMLIAPPTVENADNVTSLLQNTKTKNFRMELTKMKNIGRMSIEENKKRDQKKERNRKYIDPKLKKGATRQILIRIVNGKDSLKRVILCEIWQAQHEQRVKKWLWKLYIPHRPALAVTKWSDGWHLSRGVWHGPGLLWKLSWSRSTTVAKEVSHIPWVHFLKPVVNISLYRLPSHSQKTSTDDHVRSTVKQHGLGIPLMPWFSQAD